MSRLRLAILLVVFGCQLAVPLAMIRSVETTLREGRAFRFETAPVDPVDLFRGRYVALAFTATQGPAAAGASFTRGERAYALIETGEDGFARVRSVAHDRPASADYLAVDVDETIEDAVHFRFPVDRFYLEESVAPAAERAYLNRQTGSEGQRSWARIRVLDGQTVIEDVLLAGEPLRDAARREPADRAP